MGDRRPTRVVEGCGMRTERWAGSDETAPRIVICHDGKPVDEVSEHQADELIRQLAYIRGWQVTRG